MNMYTHPDKADRKLKRVKVSLLRDERFVFLRGALMVGTTTLSDDYPTAATDGCDEVYGRRMVEMLTERMLAFVVLHETMHKVERHTSVWRKLYEEDPDCANKACDYRINIMLHDMDPLEQTLEFPRLPDGRRLGLLDERFRGMSIPEIYRILRQQQSGGGGGNGGNGDGQSFDEHQWDKAAERTSEEQAALDKEIDQALRQGQMEQRKLVGDKAGNLDRALGELLEPQIDWRDVLADFVRSTCRGKDKSSWRRLNRRLMASDIHMPSLIGERVGRLVVGVDTSGSIGGPALNRFLAEVVGIATEVTPEAIDLLYWDTCMARHERYAEGDYDGLAKSTKPAGGGGTDPNCIRAYMEKEAIEPECVIMLTDGYVPSWPDFNCPVLWIITTKGITATTGTSIWLNPDLK